ncbi:MAG TPA: SufE family protein [Candidatus Poseidoniales archaeon]|nr:SufE family protein [Candidatus Poseidoniales archaeon]
MCIWMCKEFGTGNWPPALQEIIDEFSEIEDQMERLEILFDYSEEIDELPPAEWSESTMVHGCQSEAHIKVTFSQESGFHLIGAADAKLVQGLMAVTSIGLEGLSLEEVVNFSPDFASEMGLMNILSPSRANGFRNMLHKIQEDTKNLKE